MFDDEECQHPSTHTEESASWIDDEGNAKKQVYIICDVCGSTIWSYTTDAQTGPWD